MTDNSLSTRALISGQKADPSAPHDKGAKPLSKTAFRKLQRCRLQEVADIEDCASDLVPNTNRTAQPAEEHVELDLRGRTIGQSLDKLYAAYNTLTATLKPEMQADAFTTYLAHAGPFAKHLARLVSIALDTAEFVTTQELELRMRDDSSLADGDNYALEYAQFVEQYPFVLILSVRDDAEATHTIVFARQTLHLRVVRYMADRKKYEMQLTSLLSEIVQSMSGRSWSLADDGHEGISPRDKRAPRKQCQLRKAEGCCPVLQKGRNILAELIAHRNFTKRSFAACVLKTLSACFDWSEVPKRGKLAAASRRQREFRRGYDSDSPQDDPAGHFGGAGHQGPLAMSTEDAFTALADAGLPRPVAAADAGAMAQGDAVEQLHAPTGAHGLQPASTAGEPSGTVQHVGQLGDPQAGADHEVGPRSAPVQSQDYDPRDAVEQVLTVMPPSLAFVRHTEFEPNNAINTVLDALGVNPWIGPGRSAVDALGRVDWKHAADGRSQAYRMHDLAYSVGPKDQTQRAKYLQAADAQLATDIRRLEKQGASTPLDTLVAKLMDWRALGHSRAADAQVAELRKAADSVFGTVKEKPAVVHAINRKQRNKLQHSLNGNFDRQITEPADFDADLSAAAVREFVKERLVPRDYPDMMSASDAAQYSERLVTSLMGRMQTYEDFGFNAAPDQVRPRLRSTTSFQPWHAQGDADSSAFPTQMAAAVPYATPLNLLTAGAMDTAYYTAVGNTSNQRFLAAGQKNLRKVTYSPEALDRMAQVTEPTFQAKNVAGVVGRTATKYAQIEFARNVLSQDLEAGSNSWLALQLVHCRGWALGTNCNFDQLGYHWLHAGLTSDTPGAQMRPRAGAAGMRDGYLQLNPNSYRSVNGAETLTPFAIEDRVVVYTATEWQQQLAQAAECEQSVAGFHPSDFCAVIYLDNNNQAEPQLATMQFLQRFPVTPSIYTDMQIESGDSAIAADTRLGFETAAKRILFANTGGMVNLGLPNRPPIIGNRTPGGEPVTWYRRVAVILPPTAALESIGYYTAGPPAAGAAMAVGAVPAAQWPLVVVAGVVIPYDNYNQAPPAVYNAVDPGVIDAIETFMNNADRGVFHQMLQTAIQMEVITAAEVEEATLLMEANILRRNNVLGKQHSGSPLTAPNGAQVGTLAYLNLAGAPTVVQYAPVEHVLSYRLASVTGNAGGIADFTFAGTDTFEAAGGPVADPDTRSMPIVFDQRMGNYTAQRAMATWQHRMQTCIVPEVEPIRNASGQAGMEITRPYSMVVDALLAWGYATAQPAKTPRDTSTLAALDGAIFQRAHVLDYAAEAAVRTGLFSATNFFGRDYGPVVVRVLDGYIQDAVDMYYDWISEFHGIKFLRTRSLASNTYDEVFSGTWWSVSADTATRVSSLTQGRVLATSFLNQVAEFGLDEALAATKGRMALSGSSAVSTRVRQWPALAGAAQPVNIVQHWLPQDMCLRPGDQSLSFRLQLLSLLKRGSGVWTQQPVRWTAAMNLSEVEMTARAPYPIADRAIAANERRCNIYTLDAALPAVVWRVPIQAAVDNCVAEAIALPEFVEPTSGFIRQIACPGAYAQVVFAGSALIADVPRGVDFASAPAPIVPMTVGPSAFWQGAMKRSGRSKGAAAAEAAAPV